MATNNSQQRLAYTVNQPLTQIFNQPVISNRSPSVNDKQPLGTLWVDKLLDQTFIITSVVNNLANWAPVSQAAGALNTLTVDGGGVAVPAAGTIDIIGDGNTATSLTGASEITISLNPSPTFAGTVTANAVTTGDLTVTGDFDLASTAQIDLTSSLAAANAILLDATAGGIVLQAAGFPIALTAVNQAINLTSGTGAINIGADAVAHTVTIGNVTGATAVAVNTGTGSFTVTTTGSGDIVLNSDDTMLLDADGVLELNSSAGAIGIGNDADAQAINIGTGAAARTITMGNVTGATALVLNSGTGGVAVNTTGTGDVVVTSADTVLIDSAGVLELNSSAGVISIGNDAVAQDINVGTGAAARVITIGNLTGATGIALNAGTGDIVATSVDAITMVAAGAVQINSTAGQLAIGNSADAQPINIGTGAAARTITVGNVTGATAVVVNSGTGGVALNTTGTGDVVVTSADTVLIDAAGVLELNSSGGVISIGNDAVAQNINIGSAGARDITIGNATAGTDVIISTPANTGLTFATSLVRMMAGAGDPNGAVTAPIGSLFLRTDPAGAASRLYINTDAGTTWANFTASA